MRDELKKVRNLARTAKLQAANPQDPQELQRAILRCQAVLANVESSITDCLGAEGSKDCLEAESSKDCLGAERSKDCLVTERSKASAEMGHLPPGVKLATEHTAPSDPSFSVRTMPARLKHQLMNTQSHGEDALQDPSEEERRRTCSHEQNNRNNNFSIAQKAAPGSLLPIMGDAEPRRSSDKGTLRKGRLPQSGLAAEGAQEQLVVGKPGNPPIAWTTMPSLAVSAQASEGGPSGGPRPGTQGTLCRLLAGHRVHPVPIHSPGGGMGPPLSSREGGVATARGSPIRGKLPEASPPRSFSVQPSSYSGDLEVPMPMEPRASVDSKGLHSRKRVHMAKLQTHRILTDDLPDMCSPSSNAQASSSRSHTDVDLNLQVLSAWQTTPSRTESSTSSHVAGGSAPGGAAKGKLW